MEIINNISPQYDWAENKRNQYIRNVMDGVRLLCAPSFDMPVASVISITY